MTVYMSIYQSPIIMNKMKYEVVYISLIGQK